jgi:hypothetical protein
MKASLLHVLVLSLFLLSTVTSAQEYTIMDVDPMPVSNTGLNEIVTDAVWDIQFNYDATLVTGAAGNAGAIYIPSINRFWTSRWAANVLHQWNANGTLDMQWTASFTGTRGMVQNGQSIYHSINTTTVQIVDAVTRLVTGTIPVVGAPNGARFIAFNPDENSGAGGIIVGNWTAPNLNFYVFSLTGTLLRTITNTQTSCYGLAFDKWTNPGTPYLWVWTQGTGAGTPQLIRQMDYVTGTYTGVQHDVFADVGVGQTGPIAGGLFFTDALVPGKLTLGGMLQGTPDRLFGYEIGDIVPVELTSFTANVVGSDVRLNWSTATETNNQGFQVERSSGSEFVQIGFIDGHGTTTEIQNYSFIDKSLEAGVYSYRLKQVDFDGTFDYSNVVEIEIGALQIFTLEQNYPNPFNPSTKINFNLAVDSKVNLGIYDVLGQELATMINGNLRAGTHEIDFSGQGMNSGVYFYKLTATGVNGASFTDVKKMILTK